MQEVEDGLADVALLEDLAPVVVDLVALVVQDIVELEGALADVEVASLDLDLRLRDRASDHARLDRRGVVEPEPGHETRDPFRCEDADKLVFERAVEAGGARVALAARSTTQLVVDAARFVALGTDDVQAPEPHDALAEQDVHAAAGHIR